MFDSKANVPKFYFLCAGLDETIFEVYEFYGVDQLSSLYEFNITLISKNCIVASEEVLNKNATLLINEGELFYPYSGLISEFRLIDNSTDYCMYKVILVPHFWLANLNMQSRVFVNTSLIATARKLLNDIGIPEEEVEESTVNKNGEMEFLVQYQESDLNFLCRLLEAEGVWFFFTENSLPMVDLSKERITITNQFESFKNPDGFKKAQFKELSGLEGENCINRIQIINRVVPEKACVKNYNYRDPATELIGISKIHNGTIGTVYEYGGALKNATAVQNAALVVSNRFSARSVQVEGAGTYGWFRAGLRIKIDGHYFCELDNEECVITQVAHYGSRKNGVAAYHNTFIGIPASVAKRYAPEKRTTIPKVPGILTAKIEADSSEYAALDDKGRYKVRLHFDSSDSPKLAASKYIRLSQPYSGQQYGFHFPARQGTEVLLACVDGDPNKPIGIGTVPNADTLSPVVNTNCQHNIIRTAGGNEILLDDTDGKQKLHLKTNSRHAVEMDDENGRITVKSAGNSSITIDDRNSSIEISIKNHRIALHNGDSSRISITTEKNNVITLDDKDSRMQISTSGGHAIVLDDNDKKISVTDSKGLSSVILDGENGLLFDTKGKIAFRAEKDIEIEGANVKIAASKGDIDINASNSICEKGSAITTKADGDIAIEGSSIEAKAKSSVDIKGSSAEINANTSAKIVSNAIVEINGKNMSVVKGAVVMVN